MEVLTKTQTKQIIKEEIENVRKDLFEELDKVRREIIKLGDEIKCKNKQ